MKQNAKLIFYLFGVLVLFATPSFIFELQDHELEAAISKAKTLDQVLEKRERYFNSKSSRSGDRLVNILIVPGHDDVSHGTEFRGLREVDLNRELAQDLYGYLSKEPGINVVTVSSQNGYSDIFNRYFDREKRKIEDFIKKSKKSFAKQIRKEDPELGDTTFHNTASSDVVLKLYGINKWATTQKFDLVIHIHFNDYRGRTWNEVGDKVGFSIYTPGKFLENHELSRKLADSIFEELKKVRPVSTLETEKDGVIENHALIAVGANQTVTAGSVIVEYGYIYENQFQDPSYRSVALDTYAYATYRGIKKLLNEKPDEKVFEKVSITQNKNTLDNLKWQYRQSLLGTYPPIDKNFIDCPVSGFYGDCSKGVKE